MQYTRAVNLCQIKTIDYNSLYTDNLPKLLNYFTFPCLTVQLFLKQVE